MSKGYTINFFISVFKSATVGQVNSSVYRTVSPRLGVLSTKAEALDGWLGDKTGDIASGRGHFASFGKTARARLLKALALRKKNGFV